MSTVVGGIPLQGLVPGRLLAIDQRGHDLAHHVIDGDVHHGILREVIA